MHGRRFSVGALFQLSFLIRLISSGSNQSILASSLSADLLARRSSSEFSLQSLRVPVFGALNNKRHEYRSQSGKTVPIERGPIKNEP